MRRPACERLLGRASRDRRGGLGSDSIKAEAQDFSGTDNANFSTPPDGTSGRAQMFRFVGPTTVYAFMQSAGMVDDHLDGCFVVGGSR